jgi:hypothetical protein
MKYLLLICVGGPLAVDPNELDPKDLEIEPWVDEMDGRGVRLMGERLRPAEEATTVRVRNGETMLTDGPYTETKELIAGFDVIECADLDEAVEVASKHPIAKTGMIEVRPFWTD